METITIGHGLGDEEAQEALELRLGEIGLATDEHAYEDYARAVRDGRTEFTVQAWRVDDQGTRLPWTQVGQDILLVWEGSACFCRDDCGKQMTTRLVTVEHECNCGGECDSNREPDEWLFEGGAEDAIDDAMRRRGLSAPPGLGMWIGDAEDCHGRTMVDAQWWITTEPAVPGFCGDHDCCYAGHWSAADRW